MQKRKLDRDKLDAAGRILFRGMRRPGVDIETIIADPGLFDRVRSRIAADNEKTAERRQSLWTVGLMPRILAAGAAVTVIAAFIAGVSSWSRNDAPTPVLTKQLPETVPDAARPDNPPKPMFSKLPSGRAPFSNAKSVPVGTTYKRSMPKMVPRPTDEGASDFYAVTLTGDHNEMAGGGRIVRVDMPRSSLFAMGINIPLENDREMIKTDLLIGSDGTTRAVRIVD
jgi:hypothetical protein